MEPIAEIKDRVLNVNQLIDELTYLNYRFNRENAPQVTPLEWAAIYHDAERMERRFQSGL